MYNSTNLGERKAPHIVGECQQQRFNSGIPVRAISHIRRNRTEPKP